MRHYDDGEPEEPNEMGCDGGGSKGGKVTLNELATRLTCNVIGAASICSAARAPIAFPHIRINF